MRDREAAESDNRTIGKDVSGSAYQGYTMVAQRFGRLWVASDLGYQDLQAERINTARMALYD